MGEITYSHANIQIFGGMVDKKGYSVDLCKACQEILLSFIPKACTHPALAAGVCAICGDDP